MPNKSELTKKLNENKKEFGLLIAQIIENAPTTQREAIARQMVDSNKGSQRIAIRLLSDTQITVTVFHGIVLGCYLKTVNVAINDDGYTCGDRVPKHYDTIKEGKIVA